ncbi:DMT family transporter [Galactobacter sp.]|uniref:EamA family transporter n=1 Tax=Galactobacter sp. TaxID=2676125 RepID=UPI0025BCB5E8|nr:DMT family transporter [Galactobacter sp.]
MQRNVLLGLTALLLSAYLFAASGPLAKVLYGIGWPPGSVALLRLAGATALLSAPTLLALRGRWDEVRRRWKAIMGYGIVAMAGVQIFFFLALEHLSVAVAVLVEMMGAPVLIVVWVWLRTRRFPGAVICAGLVVCLVGMMLVLDFRGARMSWLGLALAVAAAGCMAGYFMVSSNQSINLPPIAFTGLGMAVGAVVAVITTLTKLTPAEFVVADVDFAGFAVSWWVPALLLLFTTAGAYWLGLIGLRHLGPTLGSFANLTEVPFSTITAWVILGEALTGWQLVGGLVILAGIVLVKARDPERPVA